MTANNSDNPVVDVKEKVRAFVLEYAAGKGHHRRHRHGAGELPNSQRR